MNGVGVEKSRLPRCIRAGYGAADLGISASLLMVQLYLFEYYTRVAGLSPALVGTAAALAIVWDAVSDPLMGAICDRTRSRWGRFLPYMVIGGGTLPLALLALFHPPTAPSTGGLFTYLLGSYLAFNTALTLLGVPHLALGGTLSADSGERNELYGWRLVFGTFGLFLGVVAPLFMTHFLALDPSTNDGMVASRSGGSVLVALVILGSAALTLGAAWQRGRTVDSAASASVGWREVRDAFRATARNRFFLPLLLSFFLVSLGRAMNGLLALPYYKYALKLPEATVQQNILGVFALCIVLSVVGWTWLSKRYGKKWPGFWGMSTLGLLTCVAYPLFPSGQLVGPILAAIVGGVAVGSILLFESMVTDAADADWLEHGRRRDGLYFGCWRLGQKLASSVGIFLTTLLLEAIGYREGVAVQGEIVGRRLAWLFGPGVGLFFLLGAFVFSRSPLDHVSENALQRAVRRRRETKEHFPPS